jgi:DNA-binding transcriptional MerR regulator
MHIGELARRTGLSVKTVRYYSDLGLVPEHDRTHAGHRRYGTDALVRLNFVRTLRELGLDLSTIRRVLDREADLTGVAARHADALDAQIRVLRVQRAVLRALARRQPSPQEVEHMTRIARATADERRRVIAEFLDSIFEGIPVDPDFESRLRSASPELPDEPTDEQVNAWLELSELVADPDFRALLRRMGQGSFDPPPGTPRVAPVDQETATATANLVAERAGAAVEQGIEPGSAQAAPVLDEIVGAFAASVDRTDDPTYRRQLLAVWEVAADPRPNRYWELMAIINGWPAWPNPAPAWHWTIDALRASVSD